MLVKILASGHEDIVEGCQFYDSQQEGLGRYFTDYVYCELESLSFLGGMHVRFDDYYKMVLKKFPYSVYYKIQDGCVIVWRILDNRRNPRWRDLQLV